MQNRTRCLWVDYLFIRCISMITNNCVQHSILNLTFFVNLGFLGPLCRIIKIRIRRKIWKQSDFLSYRKNDYVSGDTA